jgi:hypothetical protein
MSLMTGLRPPVVTNLAICGCAVICWNRLCDLDSGLALSRAIAFPSPPIFSLVANLILALRAIILFWNWFLFYDARNRKAVVSFAGAGPPFLLFPSPSPPLPRPSAILLTYLANHALPNTSPLPLPRIRLGPSRAGRISTNTPWSHDGDTPPSPGERKSAQSDSGHSDSADD